MAFFVTEFKHLEIQLKDIITATENFDESKVIGVGGFGKVYIGELSLSQSGEKSLVAIKRLDRRYGQGDPEFFKEIRMLSCYRHENLISLLGFCKQGGEMILIYEFASHGSLDRYLSSADLTWVQRLRICIDAAKGLSFLHDPNGTQQRVLHCDIKSANILLDKNMTAKVSDFGLSKMGPANQQFSLLITSAVGTPGYCDPLYMETYSLTKESDVYSFGVVLFEVLCGRQCVENIKGQLKVYVPLWRKSYGENKLDDIILQDLRKQMDPSSLKTFSDIAFQCLRKAREERPTMSRVVEELEIALDSQEFPDLRLKLLTRYEAILKAKDPLLIYRTGNQLKELLSKGLVVNDGRMWFSVTEKGEHIERIYIQACLDRDEIPSYSLQHPSDRFPGALLYVYNLDFRACVRGQYLTPQISYMVNLVFRYYTESDVNSYNPMRYKLDGEEDETKVFLINTTAHMREDGWFIAPLYQFTSQHTTADLRFVFESRWIVLLVAGFEFQPSEEKVELNNPVFEEYQDIVKAASQSLSYKSLDELKQILSKGIHLNGYKTCLSLNEKGECCHMISMEDCLIPNEDFPSRYKSHWWSRFPAGFHQTNNKEFKTHVKTRFLSPFVIYTVHLVIKSSSCNKQAYVDLKYRLKGETTTSTVYLANLREDEHLYMAELFRFTSDDSIVDLEINFENSGTNIEGVEGILFQPLEKVRWHIQLEDQLLEDDKVDDIQTITDLDTYWEQKIPNEYEETLKLAKDSVEYKTWKALSLNLRKGIPWLSVDKIGKKCKMLSARAALVIDDNNSTWESSNESRLGEVLVITACHKFEIKREIKSDVVLPETNYASYLVYKLPRDQSTFEAPMFVRKKDGYRNNGWYIYLVSPPVTPVIGPNIDENSYRPLNRHKLNAVPRHRSDGWMEVKVWQFDTRKTPKTVSMHLKFKHPGKKDLSGLRVQGIELRPV